MQNMFTNCTVLTTIQFGNNWDTSKVTILYGLFYNCYLLNNIDWGLFTTNSVINMEYAFCDAFKICENEVILDFSRFDTKNVEKMSSMFNNCYRLKAIYVSPETQSKEDNNNEDISTSSSIITADNITEYISNELFPNDESVATVKQEGDT